MYQAALEMQQLYSAKNSTRALNGASWGNECVATVQGVSTLAGDPSIGGDTNAVSTFWNALQSNNSAINEGYSQTTTPVPGDIVVLTDNSADPGTHVGIYMGDGTMLSNSSSNGSFTWEASVSSESAAAAYADQEGGVPQGTYSAGTTYYYHHP
jgi:hypothetical protein